MDVRTCRVDEIDAIALTEGDLSAVVVPELGGKICSVRWRGRELLTRNPLRPAVYGRPYADFDASGFDECLPTIGPVPTQCGRGRRLPASTGCKYAPPTAPARCRQDRCTSRCPTGQPAGTR